MEKSSATTISIINKSKMEHCLISLAPLAEQQRIVDCIESLFAKLDEAKEKAQEALESFETRKKALLYNAFAGNITKKWRLRHNDAHLSSSFCEDGKTAIVDRDGMSFGAFMAIFRCKNNRYVYYFLNSPFFRNMIDQDVGTTTINQVTQAIIKNLPIPIAPEEEQTEIVHILDDFFAKETEAKAQIEASIDSIEVMKKSILAKAFRGELGTNNPEDKSAEELLKRMLA